MPSQPLSRTRTRLLFAALSAWTIALCAVPLGAAEPVPPGQFGTLHRMIKPLPREQKWAEIPWKASLWEARELAAREGKPILLWEMDGHPLGCV